MNSAEISAMKFFANLNFGHIDSIFIFILPILLDIMILFVLFIITYLACYFNILKYYFVIIYNQQL